MAAENTHFYQILQAIHSHANHNWKTRGLVGQLYVQPLNWTHTDLGRAAAPAKGGGGWGREEPQRRGTGRCRQKAVPSHPQPCSHGHFLL